MRKWLRVLRRLFFAVSLLFVLKLYTGGYKELFTLRIQQELSAHNIPCEVRDVSIVPILRPSVGSLRCNFPKVGQSVEFSELEMAFLWLDLFRLRPGVRAEGKIFGGNFDLKINRGILNGAVYLDYRLGGIDLGSLPSKMPIAPKGQLFSILHLQILPPPQIDLKGQGNLHIDDFGLSTSGVGRLPLPEIVGGDLEAEVSIAGDKALLKPLRLTSDFGEMEGEFEAIIQNLISLPVYSGSIDIQLTELGLRKIGGYLALAARKDLKNPPEEWHLSINGQGSSMPTVRVEERK